MSEKEPGEGEKPTSRTSPRTALATAGRMRASENRHAARLEARGWLCIAPELAEAVRALVANAGLETADPR